MKRGPFLSLCTVFDAIPSNIDELLSMDSSAHVFVFREFYTHYKDWLTYSGKTDRPDEHCYNLSISNNLTQMVNFLTRIPDCDSDIPALLDFFLSSDTSICSTMAFPLLWNSDQVVASVSTDFASNSEWDNLFYCITYKYFCVIGIVFVVIWEMF